MVLLKIKEKFLSVKKVYDYDNCFVNGVELRSPVSFRGFQVTLKYHGIKVWASNLVDTKEKAVALKKTIARRHRIAFCGDGTPVMM